MSKMRVTPCVINNPKSALHGNIYMRAFYEKVLDVQDLAEHIMQDSKVERGTVVAVVDAVVKQIGELLCNGHPIRIPHLGLLKLGVSSDGAASLKEFNAGRHIRSLHLVLTPDAEIKAALKKIKFEKYVPQKKSAK